jgi:adenosine deaminase
VDFKALPKIDLHRHLEGSVRFETFVELARETGIDLPKKELRRRTSMKGEKPGFKRFLSKFELYRGLYPSRDWIERVAFEAAEDAKRDGVVYLELRFSPTHFGRRMQAKGEDVAAWVARGARRAGIDVRFIATYGRDFGVKGNEPTTRAVRGTEVFSGLDLAGDEAVSALPFVPLFKKLNLPVTIHAGEAGGPENVRQAIEKFGARRIGHGVRVLEDPAVVLLAKERGVVFEVCPTSELQTGVARSWKTHPARRMKEEFRFHVTLATDDPSICGTDLTTEYRRAFRSGWKWWELAWAGAAGAHAAFAPREKKRELSRLIHSKWSGRPWKRIESDFLKLIQSLAPSR